MTEKKKTIFLTGGTGLLGSYLLRIFLENGHKVFVLARDKENIKAEERVKSVLDFWDGKLPLKNLVILKGDITKDGLGLDAETVRKLCAEVDEIYHFAAVINLNWLWFKIRDVNVTGTKTVLDLAESCSRKGKLLKVNHISTAYIYGDYEGLFTEYELDVGQEFMTTYEQSKFEAEKIAHQYRKNGLWIDIFRPPIVIGHSKTGKVLRFLNIYRVLGLCKLGFFNELPISGLKVRIVPVDSLCEAIYLLSSNAKERNKTYHPFPAQAITMKEIVDCGCKLMGVKPPKAVLLKDFDLNKLSPAELAILENNVMAINFKNQLNSDFTCALLKKLGFTFPELDEKRLGQIFSYFVEKRGGSE